MTHAGRGLVVWCTLMVSLSLAAASLVLFALNLNHPNPISVEYFLPNVVTAVLFSIVGALIVLRRPENVIGRIFCVLGFAGGVVACGGEYAVYALITAPGSLPAGNAAAWLSSLALNVLWTTGLTLVFLLFPTGRALSKRWRVVVWIAVADIVLSTTFGSIRPGQFDEPFQFATNPFGIGGHSVIVDLLQFMTAILAPLPLLLGVVSLASLIVRFRRSRGDERQQLKWFVYAATSFLVIFIGLNIVEGLPAPYSEHGPWNDIAETIVIVGFLCAGIPSAVGIAILRYRLYEIDRVINRTLVYAVLTVCLALVYLTLVIGLGEIVRLVTHESSSLTVGVSTLAVAALFRPLRNRIQSGVDRRFYRHKYDAAQTLAAFSARLQDEIDLEVLSGELMFVVRETVQPRHVSVWLRDTPS